jgi:hypothetical protein
MVNPTNRPVPASIDSPKNGSPVCADVALGTTLPEVVGGMVVGGVGTEVDDKAPVADIERLVLAIS